jgi:ribosome-binding factor A
MPSPIRLKKIADRIKDDLSELLIYEVEDPRLSGVMVTDVNVDRELYYANIYVSAIEGKERSKEVLAGLESASGFLRSQLAQGIELRSFPRLRFYWDPTPENADRIEFLLKQLHEEEAAKAAAAASDNQNDEPGEKAE